MPIRDRIIIVNEKRINQRVSFTDIKIKSKMLNNNLDADIGDQT